MNELSQGSEFAGHRIEDVAGQGGMGVVYRATHMALEITVALKLIKPELARDEGFRERFKRESRLAASIEHPNVLPVRHAGEEDGLLYITMRYVEGSDLRELIDRNGRIEPARACEIVSGVAAALDAAHANGLVHRDVKPANVLLEGADGSGHAYLTDFGLTRQASSAAGLTKTGQWVGTLDYVAPEQIEGREVDARADIYALGCVLYESLTGKVPFLKDSEVATMYAHLNEPAPEMREHAPEISPELDAVVKRAMAKEPDERFPSAGDLATAATAAAKGAAIAQPEQSVASGRAAATAPGPAAQEETAPSRPALSDSDSAAKRGVGEAATSATPPPPPTRTSPTAGGAGATPPPSPPPPPPPPKGRKPAKSGSRKPLLAAIGGVAALVIIVGALFAAGVIGGESEEDRQREQAAREAAAAQAAEEEAAAQETAAEGTIDAFRGAFQSEGLSTIELLLVDDAPYQYLGFDEKPAVDEYRDLFAAIKVRDYQLTVDQIEFEEDSSPPAVNAELAYDYRAGDSGNRVSGKLEWRLQRDGSDGEYLIDELMATPDFYSYFDIGDPPVSYNVKLFAGRTNQIGGTKGTISQDGEDVPIRIPVDSEAASDLDGSETIRSVTTFRESSGRSTDTVKLSFPFAS